MIPNPASLPHKIIGVAIIWNNQGKILIDRRKPQGEMAGLWEFPGGKVEPHETIAQCIKREIAEELNIVIAVGEKLLTIEHTYNSFRVTLHVHHCDYVSGEPQPIECDEILWVTPTQLDHFTFPAANQQIIAALQQQ